MTNWEVLTLVKAASRPRAKKKAAGRFVCRIAALGAALVFLLPVLQLRGVGAGTSLALGILGQGLDLGDLGQAAAPVVSYALTYTTGEGFAFQKVDDTLIRINVDGATMITQEPMPSMKQILADACIGLGNQDRAQATMTVDGQGIESLPEITVTRVRGQNRLRDGVDSQTGDQGERPVPGPGTECGALTGAARSPAEAV